jgi:CheY-like chemotaxis protein
MIFSLFTSEEIVCIMDINGEIMKKKILIVDDVDTIARIYTRFLDRQGYEVRIAFNGEEACEMAETFKPDLVISDIKMPRMNGFELASFLRKKNPNQKIILMTGYADEAEILEQQKQHGYPYFTKPADLQITLQTIVQEVMDGTYKMEEVQDSGNLKVLDSNDLIYGSVIHSLKNEFAIIGDSIKIIEKLSNNSAEIIEECKIIQESLLFCQVSSRKYIDMIGIGKTKVYKVSIINTITKAFNLLKRRVPKAVIFELNVGKFEKDECVNANEEQLIGIIVGLVNNSINSIERKNGKINIDVNRNTDFIEITTSDNGKGIPDLIKHKVFISQINSTNGLGLGLLFTKKIIDSWSGQIEFITDMNGTSVKIILPVV